jgi:hypothetical protein
VQETASSLELVAGAAAGRMVGLGIVGIGFATVATDGFAAPDADGVATGVPVALLEDRVLPVTVAVLSCGLSEHGLRTVG